MTKIEKCRLCNSEDLFTFLRLGEMPLAGNFLNKDQIGTESSYPLDICFCKTCTSVQVTEMIPRDTFFKDYRYLSSVATKSVIEHFEKYAKEIKDRFTQNGGFVLEIACNDGILLKPLKDLGVRALGVDPAVNVVKVARDRGLDVINDYFEFDLSQKLSEKYGRANVIVGNAVFAHLDNMNDIFKGVWNMLDDNGVFVFEVNYLGDMIDELQYDVIYHEHTLYHSVFALKQFLKKHKMKIFDVKHLPIRGGTIRIYSCKENATFEISDNVQKILDIEKQKGYDKIETYFEFAKRCEAHKKKMLDLLHNLKNRGKKIIGYGMSGRGNTMLNYWHVGIDILDYGIDASPERYGRFVPGMHIPIHPPSPLDGIDYVLLLAWIFADDIIRKENDFVKKGGKFIIPFPEPHLRP